MRGGKTENKERAKNVMQKRNLSFPNIDQNKISNELTCKAEDSLRPCDDCEDDDEDDEDHHDDHNHNRAGTQGLWKWAK